MSASYFVNWRNFWALIRNDASLNTTRDIKLLDAVGSQVVREASLIHGVQPDYYTRHPDNKFRLAVPQPVHQRTVVAVSANTESKMVTEQLRFLLSQVPMREAPKDLFEARRSVTPFAYVHPKTWSKFTHMVENLECRAYFSLGGSPTKWVVTSLMPEGTAVYTPNAMPGIEKLLAG
jgi:hypothetical protein